MPSIRRILSRVAKTTILAFLLVTVATAISGTWASAHNSIDTSNPADGAVVTAPLNSWVLTFANDVPLDSASAEVIGADGVRTSLPTPTHGDSQKVIRFTLPAGLTGEVSGRWRLVSSDGHVVAGRVQFDIQAAGSTTTVVDESNPVGTGNEVDTPTTTTDDRLNLAPEPVRWSLRLLNYAALFILGGLILMDAHLAPGTLRQVRASQLAKGSAVALTIVPLVQMLIFISDVRDTSVIGALRHLGEMFTSTPASMMAVRGLSGAVFVYMLSAGTSRTPNRQSTLLLGANSVVHLIALAYVGHSRSQGVPWLAIPVDAVHTAASAVWLGGLAVFIAVVLPGIDTARSLDAFVRFGAIAKYAVITIVVTGTVQTLRLHGGITTLFTTPHGRWLLLKMALVGLMLKVGDVNRKRLMRTIPTDESARERRRWMLVRASTTEAALGAAVIAVTAALVTSSLG